MCLKFVFSPAERLVFVIPVFSIHINIQGQYSVVVALFQCTHLILPPPVPTHRLELGLLCRLCRSRHLQMTQQLTHLLCKQTHSHTHTLRPPPAAPREAYASAETMCSDPARLHPLHIQHTLRASAETSALIPSSWFCLSAHLSVFRSFPPPPTTLPPFSHTPPREDNLKFSVLFQILYTLRLGRLAHR